MEAISLGVGVNGKAIGVDPSETQIVSAEDRCQSLENTEFLCCYADEIDMDDASCDSITSTQTLEYIEDVDAALNEIRRLLKNHSRFVNISTLWDYFGFHGPDKELNSLMHEVVKGQKHPMLPTKLNGKLEKLGFKNIRTHEIPFFITKRDENSFAKFLNPKSTAAMVPRRPWYPDAHADPDSETPEQSACMRALRIRI